MDRMNSKNVDLYVDLEEGRAGRDEDGDRNPSSDGRKKFFSRSWSGHMKIDGSTSSSEGSSDFSCKSEGKLRRVFTNFFDKNIPSEKRKITSLNIPSKPPRPPGAPSLDASDMKWMREFAELAELKRKRVERMKKLRTMRNPKNSSSANNTNTNLLALVVTTLFCFVIISQGLCTWNSQLTDLQTSPILSKVQRNKYDYCGLRIQEPSWKRKCLSGLDLKSNFAQSC